MKKEELRVRLSEIIPIRMHSRMMDRVVNVCEQYAVEYAEIEAKDRLDKLEDSMRVISEHISDLKGKHIDVLEETGYNLTLKEREKLSIQDAFVQCGGNRRLMAQYLGISERSMYRKLDKYDLNKDTKI